MLEKDYFDYLLQKAQLENEGGFFPLFVPDYLFDYQKSLLEWAVCKGRAAVFADCGLGKSVIELVWAQNIVEKTNGNVLLLTPIAVGQQMLEEAEKFGIEAYRSRDGKAHGQITITNYEQLHKFDPVDFVGVVCDESGILKNFDGKYKQEINIFMRKCPYRLLATATAAPNDFVELGTSSEALGYLGYMDMLSKFFKNDQNNCATNRRGRFTEETKWRLKGHAHDAFWRWVCSWARAVRKPSDLGFSDANHVLPELREQNYMVDMIGRTFTGKFDLGQAAVGLKEQRDARRGTLQQRCEKCAELVNAHNDYSVSWCGLNDEGDLLEKLIDGAVQISGKDSDESKEEKLTAFSHGTIKKLVIKPKIGAFGLNWQHCNRMTYFPTHSYEQYYQSVRRFWRFGQVRPVTVDLVYSKGDELVLANLERKKAQAEEMFTRLVEEMNNSMSIANVTKFNKKLEIPKWL